MTGNQPPQGRMPPDDKVGALIGEFLTEKKREREEAARRAQRPRRRGVVIGVLVAMCLGAAALTMVAEQPAPAPPADRLEAGDRMTLFLAAERIRDFQRRTGSLPLGLADARVDTAGLAYWRSTDSVFELWSERDGRRLRYRSTMSSDEFLGAALRILGSAP